MTGWKNNNLKEDVSPILNMVIFHCHVRSQGSNDLRMRTLFAKGDSGFEDYPFSVGKKFGDENQQKAIFWFISRVL